MLEKRVGGTLAKFFTSVYIAGLLAKQGVDLAVSGKPVDPNERRSSAASAGEVMGVGLQFAAAILLFLFLGRWLDGRLGTGPWLLLAGVFIGAGAGFYSLYRQLVIVPRQRTEERRGSGKDGER